MRACVRAWVRGVSMCVFGATLFWYKEKPELFLCILIYFVTIWLWQMICTWLLKCGVKIREASWRRVFLCQFISLQKIFHLFHVSYVQNVPHSKYFEVQWERGIFAFTVSMVFYISVSTLVLTLGYTVLLQYISKLSQ